MVTLSVPTGQSLDTQSLEATLSEVADGAETRTLQTPLRISVTKSAVWAVYPLTYSRSFNAKQYEIVALTTNCKDGAYEEDATCGWFRNADGTRVADSQGFCCPCDAQASWQQTVLGGATDSSRGNVNCDLFASNLFLNGLPASASCLRLSETWYAGYSVGIASYEFILSVSLSSGGNVSETLQLSPVTLVAVGANQTVAAELLGDLGGFQETPVLIQKMLFIPRPNSSAAGDGGDPARWPLLDTAAVSLDGSGCDKPGVSFAGFRNQPQACSQTAGACLSNQLQDIVDADAALAAQGHTPRHNLGALGLGSPSLRDPLPGAPSPSRKRLALPSTQLRNSIVTLTLNADAVRFVVNFAPGRILSASAVDFNGRTSGGFVALSGNGRLAASIVNNGTIAASFYLAVLNCSSGVALIPSPGAIAVPPGGVYTQQWACTVEDDSAADRNCTVVLQDARFVVIDTRLIHFYTNATQYDAIPQLDGRALGTGVGDAPGGDKGCEACPLLNVLCSMLAFCWLRLFQGLLIYALILAAAYWVMVRCGPCQLVAQARRNAQAGPQPAQGRSEAQLTAPKAQRARGAHEEARDLELAALEAELGRQGTPRRYSGQGLSRYELMLVEAALEEEEEPRDTSGGGTPSKSKNKKPRRGARV